MIVFERPVHFQDVDAAGIVFYARLVEYTHDAMAHFFGALETSTPEVSGYVDLIMRRRIGFPAVHIEADFRAPLRYGDVVLVETSLTKVGTSSCSFRYVLRRKHDSVVAGTVTHVAVSTALETVTKVPLPADCRKLLEAHLQPV